MIKKETLKKIKDALRPSYRKIQRTLNRIYRYPKIISGKPLEDFAFDVHSQNGEDGVIEELLRRLAINKGWIVEFGAWDGIYCSNTFHLLEKKNSGFKAVYIEGDKKRFEDLLITTKRMDDKIVPINKFVEISGENSLDSILSKTPLPKSFDILSIDVDSTDYQIWKSLKNYNPKIVIIEINSSLPIDLEQIHDKENGKRGSSFLSTLKLGNSKDYTLVYHKGNMFFVRNDLLPLAKTNMKSFKEQARLYKRKG